jgi:hypothetical protein
MKRQIAFITSIVLALATSAIPLTTDANAAVVRHHSVHHTAAHHGGAHRHAVRGGHGHRGGWVSGGWTGDDRVGDDGWIDGYYNGYGSYDGYAGDYCRTIQWTLDLCGPHGP